MLDLRHGFSGAGGGGPGFVSCWYEGAVMHRILGFAASLFRLGLGPLLVSTGPIDR
jgi:hypothetical protein